MKIRLTSDIENRYVPNKANYNNEQVFWPSLLSNRVISHMSMIEKPKVLDIGCAYGDYIRWLHSELDDFCYWAVDIDEPAQAYCRGMYPDKVEEQQKYDLILCLGVIELSTNEEIQQIFDKIQEKSHKDTMVIIGTDVFAILDYKSILSYLLSFGQVAEFYRKKKYYKNVMTHATAEHVISQHGFIIKNIFSISDFFTPSSRFLRFYDKWFRHKSFRSSVFYEISVSW